MRLFLLLSVFCFGFCVAAADEQTRITELDALWAKVSKSVNEGDFPSYQETCHPDAVLVSGTKEKAYPLSQALARWKQEFDDTRTGQMEASVEFRFSHRYGDESAAHEEGMFLYSFQKKGEEVVHREYIHFEGLLVKKDGRWLLMMEYQKSVGTEAEWTALAPTAP